MKHKDIEDAVLEKVIRKLYGIAMMKIMLGQPPKVNVKEFKLMLSKRGLRKDWFRIAKLLHKEKIITYRHSHSLEVHLTHQALFGLYSFGKPPEPHNGIHSKTALSPSYSRQKRSKR